MNNTRSNQTKQYQGELDHFSSLNNPIEIRTRALSSKQQALNTTRSGQQRSSIQLHQIRQFEDASVGQNHSSLRQT